MLSLSILSISFSIASELLLCLGEAFAFTFVPSIEMLEPIKPISLQNVTICEKISIIDSTSPTGSENHLSPLRFQTFTEKYFEIGMKLNDFSIQLVKY